MKLLTLNLFLILSVSLFAQQTETRYLSGTGADQTVDWEFYCSAGMNSGSWTKIPVPSCWEQQGFGSYNYGHDPFEKRLNETGQYRHRFSIPQAWKDKTVEMVFEGVMTDAEVKVNGKLAGPVHQGAFYRFSYDITKLLKYGQENQLEVFVKKHSDNLSVSLAERKADFWIFGGIFRPVYLQAKPKLHIQRVAVDARANGEFKADVFLSPATKTGKVRVEIRDLAGKPQAVFEKPIGSAIERIDGHLSDPQTWSPEFPNLYTAVFSIRDKNNQTIHEHREQIGFRTVEVRESDGIYVNGVRIKMKGVNRHTFHPKYGRTSSKNLSIAAVNLMKNMNMNAVRMSHYPPDKHFLEVCDSLGLFVLDELTAWQKPSYDDLVGRKLLEELIARDLNHPCVILWDNGNEGGENNQLNDAFAELDIQQRKVLHPWQDYELTNTLHYIDYDYLALDGFSKRKIFFPTEFLHGLYDGGHGAGLDDYWQKMWSDPLCAGGFLWVFADEAVERTDRNGELDTDGNHAPDGILGPYHEKEGSFYTIKEIWSPVYFEKKYINPYFDGTFNIENRYHYTNLNQCHFTAEWLKFSNPGGHLSELVVQSQNLKADLPPGKTGALNVDLIAGWASCDALRISMTDLYGRKLNSWSWPVKRARDLAGEQLASLPGRRPQLEETASDYHVTAGELEISIRKKDGAIAQIRNKGQIIPLANGPVFVSNEKVVTEVTHAFTGESLEIRTMFENGDSFTWSIPGNGSLNLHVAYEPAGGCEFAGISFDFPEKHISGIKWLGNGPYRVYKNRMKGANFGLWEKSFNQSITGESGFEYPEFKGYHANMYRAEIQGNETPGFTVYIKSDDIFLKMLTPGEPAAPANTKISYPKGDISFLHGINAIGTKFMKADRLGPQSSTYYFNPAKIHGEKLLMDLTFTF